MADQNRLSRIPRLVQVQKEGYQQRAKWINVFDVSAVIPNSFDERRSTIILSNGEHVHSNMGQYELAQVINTALQEEYDREATQ